MCASDPCSDLLCHCLVVEDDTAPYYFLSGFGSSEDTACNIFRSYLTRGLGPVCCQCWSSGSWGLRDSARALQCCVCAPRSFSALQVVARSSITLFVSESPPVVHPAYMQEPQRHSKDTCRSAPPRRFLSHSASGRFL